MKKTVFWAAICLTVTTLVPSCSQNEGEVKNKAENDQQKIEKMEHLLKSYGFTRAPNVSKEENDSFLLAADYKETEALLKALKQGFVTIGGGVARVDTLKNERPQ